VLPYVLTPDEIDVLLSSVTKILPSVLDPYETPKFVGEAIAEVTPLIAQKNPAVLHKLSRMRSTPLKSIFEGCIRGGFPSRI